eukprot:XP_024440645.1 probable NEDD8-conjugating enzyme Ubc12-like [Populus trichocarpa]
MIKLFKVKENQRETQSADGKPPVKKQSSGELRLQKGPKCTIQSTRSRLELLKECAYFLSPFFCPLFYGHLVPSLARKYRTAADITELNLPKSCCISFPDGKDSLMNFEVTIKPGEGYYKGGKFVFSFQVSPLYPHDAP